MHGQQNIKFILFFLFFYLTFRTSLVISKQLSQVFSKKFALIFCSCGPTQSLLFKFSKYEGDLESKERFAIKKYLLIIGKKKNMQVLSHTFTYFST